MIEGIFLRLDIFDSGMFLGRKTSPAFCWVWGFWVQSADSRLFPGRVVLQTLKLAKLQPNSFTVAKPWYRITSHLYVSARDFLGVRFWAREVRWPG